MNLRDYIDPARLPDDAPDPRASQRVAAQKRAAHDIPEPIAPLAKRTRSAVPFGIGAALLIALMIGAASYQLAQLGSATPLAVTPGPSTQAFLSTPAQAFGSDLKISPQASPAPTSAPQPTDAPRFTPAPVQPAQSGRGLTVDNSAGAEVATPTPEPPAEPSYIDNVGAQAPHSPRGDGQPGPNGAAEGDWALVPTVAPAMLEVIGNQVPHKVR